MSDPRLPVPPKDAQAVSQALAAALRKEIRATGDLSFARYMELALYEPGLGYYSAGARKFGEGGDFVTAPEISPLFSRCLARQCAQILAAIDGDQKSTILELGAGSGVMAADMLAELATMDCLPDRYLILEVSADLRDRQQAKLATDMPEYFPRIDWLVNLPAEPIHGCIVANEVLDALPVERFVIADEGLQQLMVGLEGDRFCLQSREMPVDLASRLTQCLRRPVTDFPGGYASEFCPLLPSWTTAIASCLARGMLLFTDYGLTRADYYHPERASGTLMCHYRQRAHDDVFFWPGLQDITAWVEFSTLAEAAAKGGLDLAGFTTQAHWLLALGLDELVAQSVGSGQKAQVELAQQVKTLTLPGEMGERFKAIAFARGLDFALRGFAMRDFSDRL
ncbi:MAG: SAM-dependent methyltransferase [Gammaproteobacteria bacterium]|nr:SAM-dependent methyltransferase [Gammaproteobacteria bacterium]